MMLLSPLPPLPPSHRDCDKQLQHQFRQYAAPDVLARKVYKRPWRLDSSGNRTPKHNAQYGDGSGDYFRAISGNFSEFLLSGKLIVWAKARALTKLTSAFYI